MCETYLAPHIFAIILLACQTILIFRHLYLFIHTPLSLLDKPILGLKDWAEILVTEKKYPAAEVKVRRALELLEDRDSDGLFSLGVILSEQGKDDESIAAYQKSLALNAGDDAQLCYNLGIKLGVRGDTKGEMRMYARATAIDPSFGGAWLNWGTTFAESGDIDNVSWLMVYSIYIRM